MQIPCVSGQVAQLVIPSCQGFGSISGQGTYKNQPTNA